MLMHDDSSIQRLLERWQRLERGDFGDFDGSPERLRTLLTRHYAIDADEADRQIAEFQADAALLRPPG
jgi:hypothetical protein